MSIPGALTCTRRQRARRAVVLAFMVLAALAAASFTPAAAEHHRTGSPQVAFLAVAEDDGPADRDHHHGSHLSPGLPSADGLELLSALTPNRALRPRPAASAQPAGINRELTSPRVRDLSQPGVLRV
jgi:hypothetical protein